MDNNVLVVGKLFQEGTTKYQEGARFSMSRGIPMLEIYYNKPTSKEKQDMKSGVIQTRVGTYEDIIFLFFRIGTDNWLECPFTIHRESPNITLEDVEKGEGLAITIVLVDASTGILISMRLVAMEHEASVKLIQAIEHQKTLPYTHKTYDSKLSNMFQKYDVFELMNLVLKE